MELLNKFINNVEKKVFKISALDEEAIDLLCFPNLKYAVCGKCYKCGAWTSDQDAPEHIEGFSDGILEDGKWLCDLCLPPEHPKAF